MYAPKTDAEIASAENTVIPWMFYTILLIGMIKKINVRKC